jgi:tryptophan synthase beta chain
MYIPKASKFDPDKNGHFGIFSDTSTAFGGRYVPETLMPALLKLKEEYDTIRFNEDFWKEVDYYLKDYVGRPSPLYHAENISKELGAKIYLKREDLNHTGAFLHRGCGYAH